MSDIIERAEKALEGVTDGPWDAAEAFGASFVCAGEGSVADSWIVRFDNRPGRAKDRTDTRFIAAARTLVPELVAALKAERRDRHLIMTTAAVLGEHLADIAELVGLQRDSEDLAITPRVQAVVAENERLRTS
jgi:hypothetical protein